MAADDDAALAQNMGAAAGIGPSTAIACRLQLCTSDFDANNRYVGQQTAQQLMRNASPACRIMIN
jgi:hypothetical protein